MALTLSKQDVMRRAWDKARRGQRVYGGKVRQYLAAALREAWAEVRYARAAVATRPVPAVLLSVGHHRDPLRWAGRGYHGFGR